MIFINEIKYGINVEDFYVNKIKQMSLFTNSCNIDKNIGTDLERYQL